MKLLLVRHAASTTQDSGRFVGSGDPPLSAAGQAQAAKLAELVCRRGPITRCVSSPQRRAWQTAGVIAARAGVGLQADSNLREVNFGRWEGLNFGEIAAKDPELLPRWMGFEPDFAFPEGESLRDFLTRVDQVATLLCVDAPLVKEKEENSVLLVTHGGIIRALLCRLLGFEPAQYTRFDLRPASLTTLHVIGDAAVLMGFNEFAAEVSA